MQCCMGARAIEDGEVYAARQHVDHGEHRGANVGKGFLQDEKAGCDSHVEQAVIPM